MGSKSKFLTVSILYLLGLLVSFLFNVPFAAAQGGLNGDCDYENYKNLKEPLCKSGLICRAADGKCVVCVTDTDCAASETCNKSGACVEKAGTGGGQDSGGGQTGSGGGPGKDEPPGYDLTITSIKNIITGIACWLIGAIFAVMIIALVIAGVRFFWASGDPTKIGAARKNLLWVVIGIAVIIATNIIIATIAGFLGADYSLLPLKCEGVNTRVIFPPTEK